MNDTIKSDIESLEHDKLVMLAVILRQRNETLVNDITQERRVYEKTIQELQSKLEVATPLIDSQRQVYETQIASLERRVRSLSSKLRAMKSNPAKVELSRESVLSPIVIQCETHLL